MANGSITDARSDETRNRVLDAQKLLQSILDRNPYGKITEIDDVRACLLLAEHHVNAALWALARIP
jgi:hypothetical protein